jgi:hypothetical protein
MYYVGLRELDVEGLVTIIGNSRFWV